MSEHIHTWVDGHLAVRSRAYETRGSITTDTGARWPRTTGSDVVSIAALVDPAIRRHGTPGVVRRWRVVLATMEQDALSAPRETFRDNRAFWSAFESAAVYLDDLAVTPPAPGVWDALLEELSERRNVGPTTDGPIAHFDNIKTYDDLYNAQLKFLWEKRGFDQLDQPAGFSGGNRKIPRTTNSDVLQLAAYWSKQLEDVKHVFGHDGVVARWKPIAADVEKLAKTGAPDAVYAKNNELWRGLQEVAIQVAVSDEAPSKWDMVVDSVKDSIVHLPQTVSGAASHAADYVEKAAEAVGHVASAAGKGLFAGLGAPVLIGVGLLGLFFITRNRDHQEAA